MRTQILGSTVGLVLLSSATTPAQNLVNNGNFEQGNTGFTSSYFNGTGFWNLTEDGTIYVGTNPGPLNAYFVNGAYSPVSGFSDHTYGNGTGNMLMVNGDANADAVVWQDSTPFSVAAGAYRFSAYIANINSFSTPDQMPELNFQISLDNGVNWQPLVTSAAPANPATWYETEVDGAFATSESSVEIRLMNDQTSVAGNDFAIDDIYFGTTATAPDIGSNPYNPNNAVAFTGVATVPEPSAMALAALGGVSLLRFRRRK